MSNPNQCRIQTNELMFECYGAPAVSYAVDSLCGYFNSSEMGSSLRDGMIINSGCNATHIIPILNGSQLISHSKRIPIGGTQHFDLLQRTLLLKYPQHKSVLTQYDHIQEIQHNHSYCSQNFKQQINFLESLYDQERLVQIEADRKRYQTYLGIDKIKSLDQ